MGYAVIFAGQGMQHPGMLPWLLRDDSVRAVERQLGENWRCRLADPAWASRNAHAQILLTGLALAAWSQLAPQLPPPAMVAGYSVGEMAAFSAAGVFDAQTALALTARRAAAMDVATSNLNTGLLAVTGGVPDAIRELCSRFDLDVAIRNGVGSVVLGGLRHRLDAAAQEALAAGLRCTLLHVALASHTRWMRSAADVFAQALLNVPFAHPRWPLVTNALGRVRDASQAREALAAQIDRTVAWDQCMQSIVEQRVDAVLEIGPGQALTRMWQQRHPDIPARSADDFRTPGAIVAWVCRALDRDR